MKASDLCQQLTENLPQFRAKALNTQLAAQLQEHCSSCSSCAEQLKEEAALDLWLAIPDEPSVAEKVALEQHIESLTSSSAHPEKTPIPWLWISALSALLLLSFLASWQPRKIAPQKSRTSLRKTDSVGDDPAKERYLDTRG